MEFDAKIESIGKTLFCRITGGWRGIDEVAFDKLINGCARPRDSALGCSYSGPNGGRIIPIDVILLGSHDERPGHRVGRETPLFRPGKQKKTTYKSLLEMEPGLVAGECACVGRKVVRHDTASSHEVVGFSRIRIRNLE